MMMKYALIIPSGAADEPLAELEGQTPLEAARTPNIDWIAINGRQGTVVTVPPGWPVGSDAAVMSILGYPLERHYPGRAPLLAAALGVELGPTDLAFCCDLVTVVDGVLVDPTAGCLGPAEAARLINDLNAQVAPASVRFHCGGSCANVMVVQDGADWRVECPTPDEAHGQPIARYLPQGPVGERMRVIAERAAALLTEHEVNQVRRDLGENPATAIWLWGPGRVVNLPRFEERNGVSAMAVATSPVVRGLVQAVGLELAEIDVTTGGGVAACRSHGDLAVAALDDMDFVLVHLAAPDTAAHAGDVAGKVRALEQIDEQVVGPLLKRLRSFEAFKIMVLPDHTTLTKTTRHSSAAVPFCLAGERVCAVLARPFNEANARHSDLHCELGHELLEYLLKR